MKSAVERKPFRIRAALTEESDELGVLLRVVHDVERERIEACLQAQHVVHALHCQRAVIDEERTGQLHAVVGDQVGLAGILLRNDVEVRRQLLEQIHQGVEATGLFKIGFVVFAGYVAEEAEHGGQERVHDDSDRVSLFSCQGVRGGVDYVGVFRLRVY